MKLFILFAVLFCQLTVYGFQSVKNFNNDTSDYKVLVFLSSTCPCSNSHVQHLNELNNVDSRIQFFGVITDNMKSRNSNEISGYYSGKGFSFPLIEDQQQILIKKYKALKTPHVTVLKRDQNGKYSTVYEGGVTDSRFFDRAKKYYLKENLNALLKGNELKFKNGKSLGCYIRRI